MKSERLLSIAASVATIAAIAFALLSTGQEWLEAAETRLRLLGEVQPQTRILMTGEAWSASGASLRAGRQRLLELDISANTRNFSVRLASQAARSVGTPCLIDGASGGVLRYRLKLGSVEVEFVGGEATLVRAQSVSDLHDHPLPLDIDVPSSAGVGSYEERLVLIFVTS